MKPSVFQLEQPHDVREAVALLARHGEEARILAGGQSLVPMMNFRIARPAVLIDINRCEDLAYVRHEAGELRIGAMTRQFTLQTDPLARLHAPALCAALAQAGPRTIRNRGTVGGSIANAYPTAHLPVVATCLGATMRVAGPAGERLIKAVEFFLGAFQTALAPDELLLELRVSAQRQGERQAFREGGNHRSGPAMVLVCGATMPLRLSVAGIAPVPLRLAELEADPGRFDAGWAADTAGCERGLDAISTFRLALAKDLVADVINELHAA